MADFVIYTWNGEVHTAIEYAKPSRNRETLSTEKFREAIPLEDHEIRRAPYALIKSLYSKQLEKVKANVGTDPDA